MNWTKSGPLFRHFALVLVPALLLAIAAGCGKPSPGVVSGKVLYNGKPVSGGIVTFRPADNTENTVPAKIGEDGKFQATLPLGEVKIAVDNRELQPIPQTDVAKRPQFPKNAKVGTEKDDPRDNAQKMAGKYVKLPAKVYDAQTSDLSFTVKPGNQTHDIEIKD